jgi:hypothetical protein
MAQAHRPCQRAPRPVRADRRLLVKRHLDHTLDGRRIQGLLPAGPAGIASQAFDPAFEVTITPAIGRPLGPKVALMIDVIPAPSAHIRTIRARQTSFCGALRPATQASSAARSSGDNWICDSVVMPQIRISASPAESFC